MTNKSGIIAHQFKPGQPKIGGRVVGSRDKVGRNFIKAIQKEFEEHGDRES